MKIFKCLTKLVHDLRKEPAEKPNYTFKYLFDARPCPKDGKFYVVDNFGVNSFDDFVTADEYISAMKQLFYDLSEKGVLHFCKHHGIEELWAHLEAGYYGPCEPQKWIHQCNLNFMDYSKVEVPDEVPYNPKFSWHPEEESYDSYNTEPDAYVIPLTITLAFLILFYAIASYPW